MKKQLIVLALLFAMLAAGCGATGEGEQGQSEDAAEETMTLVNEEQTATYGKYDAEYNEPEAYAEDSKATLLVQYPHIEDANPDLEAFINGDIEELVDGWMMKAPEYLVQSEEAVTTTVEVSCVVTRCDSEWLSLRFDFLKTETGAPYPVNTAIITRNYQLLAENPLFADTVEQAFSSEEEGALLALLVETEDYKALSEVLTEENLAFNLFQGRLYLTETELVIAFEEGILGPHALGSPTFHLSLGEVLEAFPNFFEG